MAELADPMEWRFQLSETEGLLAVDEPREPFPNFAFHVYEELHFSELMVQEILPDLCCRVC